MKSEIHAASVSPAATLVGLGRDRAVVGPGAADRVGRARCRRSNWRRSHSRSAAVSGSIYAAARGRLAALIQPWPVWLVGVGGLFGYHALYFAALRRAPPAEASLVAYLWPLLIVLFSALLPGERLAPAMSSARLLGFAGAATLFAGEAGGVRPRARPGAGSATRWRSAAPSSGRAIRCCRAG